MTSLELGSPEKSEGNLIQRTSEGVEGNKFCLFLETFLVKALLRQQATTVDLEDVWWKTTSTKQDQRDQCGGAKRVTE